MKKSLIKTVVIIGVVFLCVFILLTMIFLRGKKDGSNSYDSVPIAQYDNPLYKLLLNYVYENDFQEADPNERVDLFISKLSNIEEGTDACEISVTAFDADEYNHSVKFCGSDGQWWIFYADSLFFDRGDAHGELKRFMESQAFVNANTPTQVDMFCQELVLLSDAESEDLNSPYIDYDSVIADDESKTIKFCDSDGMWFEYHYDTKHLINCNAHSILEYLVETDSFIDSGVDAQIDMFNQVLLSVSENSSDGINTPVIAADSIEVDEMNKIIYYRYADTNIVRYYSFINHEFGFASRLTVTPEL